MSIIVDGRAIGEVFHGADAIAEIYHGADLVWSAVKWEHYTGPWETVTASRTITAPDWATMADIVVLGAGGGGSGGNGANFVHGNGGYSGSWAFTSWTMEPGRKIEITIGQGGAGGARNSAGAGGSGEETYCIPADRDWRVTAAGGAGGTGGGDRAGAGAPNYTAFATTFAGSASAGRDTNANPPGGGGGGGGGGIFGQASAGRAGARGQAHVRFSGMRPV